MTARSMLVLLLLVIAAPTSAPAQHGGAPSIRSAPKEASQYDFLVGQWDLVVRPAVSGLAAKIHGVPKMAGTWKAWRAFDGFGVEDELRITDESGNPRSLSHAMRYYDATTKRWNTSQLDVYRGTFTQSMAEWKDGTMVTTGHGTDAEGKVYATRAKYYDITPTSFRFRIERSTDEGKSSSESLGIDAKRVAATATR